MVMDLDETAWRAMLRAGPAMVQVALPSGACWALLTGVRRARRGLELVVRVTGVSLALGIDAVLEARPGAAEPRRAREPDPADTSPGLQPGAAMRQSTSAPSSTRSSEPSGSSHMPAGRPQAVPSSPSQPAAKRSGGPTGRPARKRTRTTS